MDRMGELLEELRLLKKQMYNFIVRNNVIITMGYGDIMSHFMVWLNHSEARNRGVEWSIPELIGANPVIREDVPTNGGTALEDEWNVFLELVTKYSDEKLRKLV